MGDDSDVVRARRDEGRKTEAERLTAALAVHASGSEAADGPGFADMVWRYRREGGQLDLLGAADSIIEVLQGLVSRGTFAVAGPFVIRAEYSVAEILTTALELSISDNSLGADRFAWRVVCAWQAALAGDIDNLQEHVNLEADARGLA